MGRRKASSSSNKGNSNSGIIIVAIIGVIGTIATAFFSFLSSTKPLELTIYATQTAEAKLTQLANNRPTKTASPLTESPMPELNATSSFPIQSSPQDPTESETGQRAFDPLSAESYEVEIVFTNGEIITGATMKCGPRGWSNYVANIQYTKDLDVIRNADYGPSSNRFIRFDQIARIDYLEMNNEEKKVIEQNSTYREWVRKIKLTFNDGSVWDNIYLLDFCYYDASHESGSLSEGSPQPKTIAITLRASK